MKTTSRFIITLATTALAAVALAGCASTPSSSSGSGSAPSPSSSTAPAELSTTSGSLGQIIVDAKGMTAYMFDKDRPNGTSSVCAGQCATLWPAITTTAATPVVKGVTGTVGTITGFDGNKQITVNGWPIYTFAKDTTPGGTAGQGVGGVWWVLSPSGQKVATPPAKSGY